MKILVGTPTYIGQLTTQYTISLLQLWGELPGAAHWQTTRGTLIAWARSVFASRVLEGDYTHLLFVDSDIEFPGGELWAVFDQAVGHVGPFTFRPTG